MNKKPIAELISRAARAAAPAAAVATSLASALAQAASGDLDPAFADGGRLNPVGEAGGTAWSVESLDDGSFFVGGGDITYSWGCYYDWDCTVSASSFATHVAEDGASDPGFISAGAEHVQAFAIARQADGKIVAAGRKVDRMIHFHFASGFAVFRLAADGSLDTSFASAGLFQLSGDDAGSYSEARAVHVDATGRIVVAGFRVSATGSPDLVVLRLTEDGLPDASFGTNGIYVGPALSPGTGAELVETATGGYRIAASTADGCAVFGVTAGGAADLGFGIAGTAGVVSAAETVASCASLAQQTDGGLVVAGTAGERGFVARLLASGAPDPAFAPDGAVADSVYVVSSVAATAGGRVLVAGEGLKGATLMRLVATGALDADFGEGGRAWVDLETNYNGSTGIGDIEERADGTVMVVGSDGWTRRPFAVRLQGDAGSPSAGVVGFADSYVEAAESDGQGVVQVRRSGGSAGAMDVAWQTVPDSDATEGVDYPQTSGTVHWADGESGEREIVVPIVEDHDAPEGYENIHLALGDAVGGAGRGALNASIGIQPDGAPSGQVSISWYTDTAIEGDVAQIYLRRDYYYEGEVSVTVTFDALSAAAGDDFPADPVTVTWAAGEGDEKLLELRLPDDSNREDLEQFSFELSNPTGGAILGVSTTGVVSIPASDLPVRQPPPHRPGGGGASGFLSLFLLAFLQLARGRRRT